MTKTVIVIGGGIAGCTTAYALAQRGIKVTLIEQHATVGAEASGNPCAMLYPRLNGNDALSHFALTAYLNSLAFYHSLNLTPDTFNTCGMLQLGFNAREQARIHKVATYLAESDTVEYVNADKASQLAGMAIQYDALYFKNAGWVKPKQLLTRLTQHKNISCITSSKVNNLLKYKDYYKIELNGDKTLSADYLVIANANEAKDFALASHIFTHAVRGQVSFLPVTNTTLALKNIVCGDGYLSPNIDGIHSLGATFSTENLSLSVTEHDHQANLITLRTLVPSFFASIQQPLHAGRASLRCASPDYFPLVGKLLDAQALTAKPPRPSASAETLPWQKGLFINVAHGSRGFTSAPICAEFIAQMIRDEPSTLSPDLAKLLNPNRFLLRELGLKKLAKTHY